MAFVSKEESQAKKEDQTIKNLCSLDASLGSKLDLNEFTLTEENLRISFNFSVGMVVKSVFSPFFSSFFILAESESAYKAR